MALAPCPFDSSHRLVCGRGSRFAGAFLSSVRCLDCGAEGPAHGTDDEAANAWNRRASPTREETEFTRAAEAFAKIIEDRGPDDGADTLLLAYRDAYRRLVSSRRRLSSRTGRTE